MSAGGICPLISLAAPLKQLGDYPKCPGEKCAWWPKGGDSCVVTTIARELAALPAAITSALLVLTPLVDAAQDICQAFDPYAGQNGPLTAAVESIGEIGKFMKLHQMELSSIITQLTGAGEGQDDTPRDQR